MIKQGEQTIRRGDAQLKQNLLGKDETVNVYVVNRKSGHKEFFMGANTGFQWLFTNENLSGNDIRLFGYMTTVMNWENVVEMSQQALAQALNTNPVVISRSIKVLKANGLIRDDRKVGNIKLYRVNPFISFKAKHRHVKRLREEWEEQETTAALSVS